MRRAKRACTKGGIGTHEMDLTIFLPARLHGRGRTNCRRCYWPFKVVEKVVFKGRQRTTQKTLTKSIPIWK